MGWSHKILGARSGIAPWLLGLAIPVLGASLRGPASTDGVSSNPALESLIAKLGAVDFPSREQAMDQLRALGLPALPHLRGALRHPDAEVRKRVADLVAEMEKRELTLKALTPKKISLKLDQADPGEAIAAFAKESGMRMDLSDPRDRLVGKKVTLALEKVPVWEALRLVKKALDLREKTDLDAEEDYQQDPNMMWRRRPTRISRVIYEPAPFRIQVAPRPQDEAPDQEDTTLGVRASLVPKTGSTYKLILHSQPDARIVAIKSLTPRLQDGAGKPLIPWRYTPPEPATQQRRGTQISPFPRTVPARQETLLERLAPKNGEDRSTILAGSAQIDFLQLDKPLVQVEDVFEAEGKAIEGRDGVKLEVKQALEVRPGMYQVRLLVTPVQNPVNLVPVAPLPMVPPPGVPNLPPIGPVQPLPVPLNPALIGTIQGINPGEFRFTVDGRTINPTGTGISTVVGPQGTRHELTFTFQTRGLDSLNGMSVEWVSQSLVSVDVPFEFRDLP